MEKLEVWPNVEKERPGQETARAKSSASGVPAAFVGRYGQQGGRRARKSKRSRKEV